MAEQRNYRRVLYGTVATAKAKDTVTVVVDRTFKHPRYGKYMRRRKKYMAHAPEGLAEEGDLVKLAATRPISKRKRWRVVEVVQKGDIALISQSPDVELAEAAAEEGGES